MTSNHPSSNPFITQVVPVDIKSREFPNALIKALESQEGMDIAMSLKGEDASTLVDILDQVLDSEDLDEQNRRQCLKYLRKLCGTFAILPSSFMLGPTTEERGAEPFATGSPSEVREATPNGRLVATKTLKVSTTANPEELQRLLVEEVVGWKWLNHENILPFVGVTPTPPLFSIISERMENGSITDFIKAHPNHNRLRLLVDAVTGLEHLHQHNIVHGDLKGANILIDSNHRARLADFGLISIIDESTAGSISDDRGMRGTIRWMAPELMYPEKFDFADEYRKRLPLRSTDIYALGMTILEVITGCRPFSGVATEVAVMYKVLQGERPERPPSGISDQLWGLLQSTWATEQGTRPSGRPSTSAILKQLREDVHDWRPIIPWEDDLVIFLSARKTGTKGSLERKQAQEFADKLDAALDERYLFKGKRKQYLKHLRKLCCMFDILPSSFMLTPTFDEHAATPFATGGFSDVYEATLDGRRVAVKVLKVSTETIKSVRRLLAKEVVGWKWLRHENILPFVGVSLKSPVLSIISERMENGNIMNFIKAHPDYNRLRLLAGAVAGLEYLHEYDIIHGDLKGANILIDSECCARLADFGLAVINDETTTKSAIGSRGTKGTTRYMAPELMLPEEFGFTGKFLKHLPSMSTDIYAIGMTILEVLTGRRPFSDVNNTLAVIYKVIQGDRPDKPSEGISDVLWESLVATWVAEDGPASKKRPTATTVLDQLKECVDDWGETFVPLTPAQWRETTAGSPGANG